MRLAHYSAVPFVLDRARVYPPTSGFDLKPHGLWLSVEDNDEETWPAWCEANEFGLTRLAHRTEIRLLPPAAIRVRHLATAVAVQRFHDEFRRDFGDDDYPTLRAIDWPAVQASYGGLMIAPYQWSVRLELLWYYGWDCASACIWDLSLIDGAVANEVRTDREGSPRSL